MQIAPLPVNEDARLASLQSLEALDTGAEAELDALVQVASEVCGVPISLISLVDSEQQYFKANVGLTGVSSTPRDVAFCAHAILGEDLFEVPNAEADPRFADNPLVVRAPDIRFYAGMPITLSDGNRVGTLCVIDRQPRALSEAQRGILRNLAVAAAQALEGRRAMRSMQRQALEQQRQHERLRLATQSGGIGIWDYDIKRAQVQWDEQVFALYGLAPQPGPRTLAQWAERVHPEDLPATLQAMEAACNGGPAFDCQFRVIWPDGQVRHLQALASVQRGANGEALGMVGTNWDVTAAAVHAQQLTQALERAEVASRAKGNFLASMSHEIRTPLNAIIGLSSLLLESEFNAKQRDYLEKIHDVGGVLMGVLNDVLDHARLEAGRIALQAMEVRIAEVLQKCRILFELKAQEKQIALRFDVAQDVPPLLLGDPLRLLQVINNLVGNALKFTSSGQVEVTVACSQDLGHEVELKVQVRDTGIGMDRTQCEQLFVPFHQADNSATRRYGGTGLGLSICKQLVGLMQGQIEVDSAPGVGSTFGFSVRLQRVGMDRQAWVSEVPTAAPTGAQAHLPDVDRPNALDAEGLLPQLRTLAELLDSGQTRSVPLCKAIATQLAGSPLQRSFAPLAQAVGRFEFEMALLGLRAWAGEQGWELT